MLNEYDKTNQYLCLTLAIRSLCGSSLSQSLGLKHVGEERKGEEDVRTSSNCLQFHPSGHGGRHG